MLILSSLSLHALVSENKINCIVGTHTNTLMIYEDITLKWAAQLTNIPVHVATGHFRLVIVYIYSVLLWFHKLLLKSFNVNCFTNPNLDISSQICIKTSQFNFC